MIVKSITSTEDKCITLCWNTSNSADFNSVKIPLLALMY